MEKKTKKSPSGIDKKIYLPSGYVDIPNLLDMATRHGCYVILGVGGRGCGKTYGGLDYLLNTGRKFIYLRRKQKHVEMNCNPAFNGFAKLNHDKGYNYMFSMIPKTDLAGVYEYEEDAESGKIKPVGRVLGYCASISTFCDTRSVDFSDVDYLFYDEFIPEKKERKMTDEAYTFNNVLETVNRNRELEGKSPLITFCLANSEKLDNALFVYYGLVRTAMKMRRDGQEIKFLSNRGICLVDFVNSPISRRKGDTFIYGKLNRGNRFADMAIRNEYDIDSGVTCKKQNIAEFLPVVAVGEICIYQHKSRSAYYVSYIKSGNPPTYGTSDTDLQRFERKYTWLWRAFLLDHVTFQDYSCFILFNDYFNS